MNRNKFVLHPIIITLISVISSISGALFIAGFTYNINNDYKRRNILYLCSFISIIIIITSSLLIDFNWKIIAINLLIINLFGGILLGYFYNNSFYSSYILSKSNKNNLSLMSILKGTLHGIFFSIPSAILLFLLNYVYTNTFLNSYLPFKSYFDLINSESLKFIFIIFLILSFNFSILFKNKRYVKLTKIAWLLFSTIIAVIIIYLLNILLIQIPVFQFSKINQSIFQHLSTQFLFFIIFIFFCPLIAFLIFKSRSLLEFVKHNFIAFILSMLFIITFKFYSGIQSYSYSFLGKYYEKKPDISSAIFFYKKSISLEANKYMEAYIQYRIAMLYHKIGYDSLSKDLFTSISTNPDLDIILKNRTNKFINGFNKHDSFIRKVIPGVELSTEHKDSYCAPNSMAIILKYWGEIISAGDIGKNITKSTSGTNILDIYAYCEEKGYHCIFIPFSDLAMIKDFINKDIPVMIYFKNHLISVFGYDEMLKSLIVYDIDRYDIWEDYFFDEINKEWNKTFNLLGVILPKNQTILEDQDKLINLIKKSDGIIQYFQARRETNITNKISFYQNAIYFHPEYFPAYINFYYDFPNYRKLFSKTYNIANITSNFENFYQRNKNIENVFLEKYIFFLIENNQYEKAALLLKENYLSDMKSNLLALINLQLKRYKDTISYADQDEEFAVAYAYELNGIQNMALSHYINFIENRQHSSIKSQMHLTRESKIAIKKIIRIGFKLKEYNKIFKAQKKYLQSYPYDSDVLIQFAKTFDFLPNADKIQYKDDIINKLKNSLLYQADSSNIVQINKLINEYEKGNI